MTQTLTSRLTAIRDRQLDDRAISPGEAALILERFEALDRTMDAAEHAIEVGQTAALGWELKGDEYTDVCARLAATETERDEWKTAAERATANAERLVAALEGIPRDKLPLRDRVALIAALEAPLATETNPG